jgi:hypothetical protein
MMLGTLSKPTVTVAATATSILGLVVAVATAIASLPPETLKNAFDFKKNPAGATIAIASIIVAVGGTIQAGAGRSWIPPVDGMTEVHVPVNSSVTIDGVQNGPISWMPPRKPPKPF